MSNSLMHKDVKASRDTSRGHIKGNIKGIYQGDISRGYIREHIGDT